MKKTNRIAAILAATVLTAFAAAPALTTMPVCAEGTNSVSISGISQSTAHSFELYQIMTGTYTPDQASDMRWGNGITSYKPVDSETPVSTNAGNVVDPLLLVEIADTEESNTAKKALISRFTLNSENKVTASSTGGTVQFSNLDTGYYLIKDVSTELTGDDSISSDMLIYVDGAEEAVIKSVKPSFDKAVSKDGTATKWDEVADYNIGDDVKFKLTATIPHSDNLSTYNLYSLLFKDTYTSGVTFGQIDSVTYKIGSGEETAIAAFNETENADGYKLTQTPDEGTKTGFELEVPDLIKNITKDKWNSCTDDIVVTVIYTSKLNASAPAIGVTTENAAYADATSITANGAYLVYSNNPAATDSTGSTATDNVGVFTYKLENTKYANIATEGYELNGAKFSLHKDTADGDAVSMIYDAELQAYRPIIDGESAVEYMETGYGVTGLDGKLNIVGLDTGTYVLKEDEAPASYEKIADKEFTISSVLTENASGSDATATLTLTGLDSLVDNKLIDTLTTSKPLPSTGGIGTTIFYTVGGIMVVAAGTVLITKKRMKANENS